MAADDARRQGALAGARSYGQALALARAWLRGCTGIATPDLDTQVLLAHAAAADRARVLAFPEHALSPAQAATFAALVARRAAHEPVAYLTGHREFYGLDLLVDHRVLIPRAETEQLVELALAEAQARLRTVPGALPVAADIGTGSGAIALALTAGEPRLRRIYATDISPAALALAAANARRLGLGGPIVFLQGDLLTPLPEPVDLLLANLPYVAERAADLLPPDVRRYEPGLALFAGPAGLDLLRRLLAEVPNHVRPGAVLVLELGYDQGGAVAEMARAALPGARVRIVADYAGLDRIAHITLAP